MTRREWSRRMRLWAIVQLPVGLALLLVGSLVAAGIDQPMLGYLVGSAGVLVIVTGALCYKFAVAGPWPKHLEEEP
ncbi:MAG: hypothetical protein QOD77_1319 [Thermoplasmata archaeon]|jgi:uncharacterized membrane protein|nr:hypothetical protein [Thermoplasmata archaeon]